MKRKGMMIAGGILLGGLPIIGIIRFTLSIVFWITNTIVQ